MPDEQLLGRLGIVAIGRNEGNRLRLCLQSIAEFEVPTIYVDSNSSDDSVEVARSHGVDVWQLDPAQPCSAARARREGFRELLSNHPDLEFVFFVDGDCQAESTWPRTAAGYLREHEDVAAVCGRRRELFPRGSAYNLVCDHEWNTPVGEALSVGGDAVYRVTAYREAGEFDPTVPAGEEPELCLRVRKCGWKIWRINADMTTHDAAITRFGQWWNRQLRTGYAGYDVERRFRLGIFDRIIKSAFRWVVALPLISIVATIVVAWLVSPAWGVVCLLPMISLFILQICRLTLRARNRKYNWFESFQIGFFTMAAKLPILLGALRQFAEATRGKQAQLVEYKTAESLRPQS